jgi:hypothetical protein
MMVEKTWTLESPCPIAAGTLTFLSQSFSDFDLALKIMDLGKSMSRETKNFINHSFLLPFFF